MKKFVCGLLIGIMLTLGVTTYAIPEIQSAVFSDIKLIVNGKQINSEIVSVTTTDNPGYMTNYVPARALSEALGAEVKWDGKTKTIAVETEAENVTTTASKSAENNVQLPSKVNVHGFEAVRPSEINAALKPKGYELVNAAKNNTLQIVKDNKIVLGDISFRVRDGKVYIAYDFYEANILPLLQ